MAAVLTAAEHRAREAAAMPERHLQAQVEGIARDLGWKVYHTHDSRRSAPGYPDIAAAHRDQQRILYAELKSQKGRVTDAQRDWAEVLHAAGAEVYIWRPADLLDGTITNILRGRAP